MGTFFKIESWGLFTRNKSFGKTIKVRGILEGSPKSGRHSFFPALPSKVLFQITIGIWTVETLSYFLKKFEIQSSLTVTNFFHSYICFIPLRPLEKPHSDVFYLLEKLKKFLGNISRYVVKEDTNDSFYFLPRGYPLFFYKKYPKAGGIMLTALIFIISKHKNMDLDLKINDVVEKFF